MNNATLAAWAAIVDAPVLGRVGHHRTYAAGPAHPQGHAPAWVQAAGVSLALLHVAYAAHQIAEARDLGDSSAQIVRRTRKRVTRPKGHVLKMVRRTA